MVFGYSARRATSRVPGGAPGRQPCGAARNHNARGTLDATPAAAVAPIDSSPSR